MRISSIRRTPSRVVGGFWPKIAQKSTNFGCPSRPVSLARNCARPLQVAILGSQFENKPHIKLRRKEKHSALSSFLDPNEIKNHKKYHDELPEDIFHPLRRPLCYRYC
jgi:hypothetical protein